MKKYEVTRKFTGGLLNGLIHTEVTTVKQNIGFECKKPVAGSPYIIIDCKEVQ